MRKYLVGAFIIAFSFSVNADVITETWTAEVKALTNNSADSVARDVSYNGYSIGDTITWTVIYNSQPGDHFTRYTDGVDGIADRGGNDDILHTLFCIDASYSIDCGTSLKDDGFTVLYDSASDTSGIYNTMASFLTPDEAVFDYFDFNNDTRSYRSSPYPNFTQFDYYADEFHIYADNRLFPEGGAGYAQLFYEKPNGEVWVSRIGFGNINVITSISTVPIPAAAWLFGSGLIGLAGLARKKGAA